MKTFLKIVGGVCVLSAIVGICGAVGAVSLFGRYGESMVFEGILYAGISLFLAIMLFKSASRIEELERKVSELYDSIHEMKNGSKKPTMTSYMKCPKCGGFSPKGSHHCDNCGADLYTSMY